MSIDTIRKLFVKKWIKELSIKLRRPQEDLLSEGLMAFDFGAKNVFVEYEDGSSSFYKHSFYIENEKEYAVFTEHCDYHEFKKECLQQIQEEDEVTVDKITNINWIGDGNAYVECYNQKLQLNKMELVSLRRELNNFINYYGEDFSPAQLKLFKNLSKN